MLCYKPDNDNNHKIVIFQVTERSITMSELLNANKENRLVEMFGSGTAAIISPVGSVMYR